MLYYLRNQKQQVPLQGLWTYQQWVVAYSLILSRPQVQLGGFWLLLGRKCHYHTFWDMCHSCSLQLVGIIAGWDYWLFFSIGSLHSSFLYYERSPQKDLTWFFYILYPTYVVSSVWGHTSTFWEKMKDNHKDHRILGISWAPLTKIPKGAFSCLVLGALLNS